MVEAHRISIPLYRTLPGSHYIPQSFLTAKYSSAQRIVKRKHEFLFGVPAGPFMMREVDVQRVDGLEGDAAVFYASVPAVGLGKKGERSLVFKAAFPWTVFWFFLTWIRKLPPFSTMALAVAFWQ